jgi:hypothetical protein
MAHTARSLLFGKIPLLVISADHFQIFRFVSEIEPTPASEPRVPELPFLVSTNKQRWELLGGGAINFQVFSYDKRDRPLRLGPVRGKGTFVRVLSTHLPSQLELR